MDQPEKSEANEAGSCPTCGQPMVGAGLKPCPFCGRVPKAFVDEATGEAWIECKCGVKTLRFHGASKAEAVGNVCALWNRRLGSESAGAS
jgi:hypothetical protein